MPKYGFSSWKRIENEKKKISIESLANQRQQHDVISISVYSRLVLDIKDYNR